MTFRANLNVAISRKDTRILYAQHFMRATFYAYVVVRRHIEKCLQYFTQIGSIQFIQVVGVNNFKEVVRVNNRSQVT